VKHIVEATNKKNTKNPILEDLNTLKWHKEHDVEPPKMPQDRKKIAIR